MLQSAIAQTSSAGGIEMGILQKPGVLPPISKTVKKEDLSRMSCCYGLMVFLGLAVSLVTLTMVVIYAGVWSQQSLYDDHLIVVIGGQDASEQYLNNTEILTLPVSSRKPACTHIDSVPVPVIGAIAAVLMKHVSVCGGQISTNAATTSDCYKYTYTGWERFTTMTKPRAFAASAWVPRRGWWVTGGVNSEEKDGISTTDFFSTGSNYGSSQPQNTFLLGPTLPEAVSHHCLIKKASGEAQYLLIGGSTPGNKYSSKVWDYDWIQREWSSMAPLYTGRHSHSCALAHDGEVIVVAGGLDGDSDTGGTLSVEMLEISTSMWHKMPALPHPLFGAKAAKLDPAAPHGYGPFALVGGSVDHPELMQWFRRSQFEVGNEATKRSLSIARRFAAVLVASPRLVCL